MFQWVLNVPLKFTECVNECDEIKRNDMMTKLTTLEHSAF